MTTTMADFDAAQGAERAAADALAAARAVDEVAPAGDGPGAARGPRGTPPPPTTPGPGGGRRRARRRASAVTSPRTTARRRRGRGRRTVGRSRPPDAATGGALADLPDDEVAPRRPGARPRRRRRRAGPRGRDGRRAATTRTTSSSRAPSPRRARRGARRPRRPPGRARRADEAQAAPGRDGGDGRRARAAARGGPAAVDVLDAAEADLRGGRAAPRRDDLREAALDRRGPCSTCASAGSTAWPPSCPRAR